MARYYDLKRKDMSSPGVPKSLPLITQMTLGGLDQAASKAAAASDVCPN
jgi:hypothetical protein